LYLSDIRNVVHYTNNHNSYFKKDLLLNY